jgi:hypothetical protein
MENIAELETEKLATETVETETVEAEKLAAEKLAAEKLEAEMQLFKKVLNSAIDGVKAGASNSIKNSLNFCCKTLDIAVTDPADKDGTIFPSPELAKKWLDDLFNDKLKLKVLNPRAIENMKKKGETPGMQPIEIILIVIVASSDRVVAGVSFPAGDSRDVTAFTTNAMNACPANGFDPKFECESKNNLVFVTYNCESPLKDKDMVSRAFFDQLRKDKIYVEEDDEDECPNYLEDD